MQALVGGGLLSPAQQQQRLQDMQPTAPSSPASYGLGIARMGPVFYGHTGELPGYNSYMGYDPVNKVTMVIWSNLAPGANGKGPAVTLAQALGDKIYAPTK